MSLIRLASLCGLPVLLVAGAVAAQPTPQALWREQPPPFCVTAPARAVSGQTAQKKPYARTVIGVPYAGGDIPFPTPPATVDVPRRIAALAQAAQRAAGFYSQIGLRAPRLHVEDGCFRALLVGTGARYFTGPQAGGSSAAAFYAAGLGETRDDDDIFERWVNGPQQGRATARPYLFVTEDDGFGPDFTSGIHPAKVATSLAHEMFHAIQASYPAVTDRDTADKKWVTEGLPDAIATHAVRGLRFLTAPTYALPDNFRSGNERYGKILGLRPYDYPLDLRTIPPSLYIKKGLSRDARQELASYMTSSFWRWLFEEKPVAGKEWRALPGLMLQPQPGATQREELLGWANLAAKTAVPTFVRGLYDALPAFIAERAEYPDQVAQSRKGVFAHPAWLEYMFEDSCPLLTLDETRPPQPVDITVRPLAAKCLRVKWTGKRFPESGAPIATVTATPLNSKDVALSIESLSLGHHGVKEGYVGHYRDRVKQDSVRRFQPLDLDPLLANSTDGELVLTFSNIAKDVLRTTAQEYRIEIVVDSAQAQGSVMQPAAPGGGGVRARPASTGKASGRRRSGSTPAIAGLGDEGVAVGTVEPSEVVDELQDCLNGTFKQASAGTVTQIHKQRDKPAPGAPPASCAVFQKLADPAFMAQHRGLMGVQLNLPRIPTGTRGAVNGATVEVGWYDPAMLPDHSPNISATTELVNVNITDATVSYIRGAYSARFVESQHGVNGTVSGDFIQTRADADTLEMPEDYLDYLSSDALLAFHYAGISAEQLQRMGSDARDRAREQGRGESNAAGAGASVGGAGSADECRCDCDEFGALQRPLPTERARCNSQCANYGPLAVQCTIESAVIAGQSRARINDVLQSCPSNCARLLASGPFCEDANWLQAQACRAGQGLTESARIACYLQFTTGELPEPQRSQMRSQLSDQLREMDAQAREIFLGTMLDGLQQDGRTCDTL